MLKNEWNKWAFKVEMTLRTHVAYGRPSEAFQDSPPFSSIEERKVLEGRSRGILKRLCARESAGEIDPW